MVRKHDRYRFTDMIVRETAADMLPAPEARKYHFLAAAQLEDLPGMEGPRSLHLLAAGDFEAALPEICRAAYLVRKQGSLHGCLDLLNAGRDALPPDIPDSPAVRKFRFEAPLELGNTYMRMGEPAKARQFLTQAKAAGQEDAATLLEAMPD